MAFFWIFSVSVFSAPSTKSFPLLLVGYSLFVKFFTYFQSFLTHGLHYQIVCPVSLYESFYIRSDFILNSVICCPAVFWCLGCFSFIIHTLYSSICCSSQTTKTKSTFSIPYSKKLLQQKTLVNRVQFAKVFFRQLF